jgi:hypothetical protein
LPPPEDEISRLFALMMPERAANPPCAVTAAPGSSPGQAVAPVRREVESESEAQSVAPARTEEHAALFAAIARDRARRRCREVWLHVALVAAFGLVALPLLGVWVEQLLMPAAAALTWLR